MSPSSGFLPGSSITTSTSTHGRLRSNSTSSDTRSAHSYEAATLVAESLNSSTAKVLDEDEPADGDDVPLLGDLDEKGLHTTDSRDSKGNLKEIWVCSCLAQLRLDEILCSIRLLAPPNSDSGVLLESSFSVVSVISIGRLSTKMLAGSALGSLTVLVTGTSMVQGFVSALDSLLPQAWTSGNPTHVGLWAQRMVILLGLLIIPIIGLWQNIEPVLLLLRQDPEVARFAALYLKFISFQLPGYAFNSVLRRYLQAQGLTHVPTAIVAVVAPLNVGLNYLLVRGPESVCLGFIGAPIATSISTILASVMYLSYGIYFAPHTAWHPITSQSLTSLPKLFRLGSAGVAQVAAEWWSWELMSFVVSQLGYTALATQSITMVVATTTYNIQYTVGIAVAIRTGNLLGLRDSRGARISARAATRLALLGGVTLGSIMFILRGKIAYIFTKDEEVALLVASVLPIVSLYQVVDGLASVETGILRACGKLGVSATVNFVAYYVIGLPLGSYLTLWRNMGLQGVWIGLATAVSCAALMTWVMVLRLDWDVEVREARKRVETGILTGADDSRT
ncbi:MATE efflux family protein [Ceratobasidium theobromae]|uniref:MATE efflux family protein n=1 Tax=Ceratobasidium theobromae TaxID=1582974 RepID=A0A5N5QMK4_9AGAM|nr:MATE efflux family protein [Ceratobasidium theobromae]